MSMLRQNPTHSTSPGFSLIELLVVLVIMTLLATTVSLALDLGSTESNSLEHSAAALQASFELAAEEAVLANEYLGLFLSESEQERALGWMRYRSGNWHALGPTLPEVPLALDLGLDLSLQGEAVTLAAGPEPLLLMDPTGYPGDFELRLHQRNSRSGFVLYTSELGELSTTWREY